MHLNFALPLIASLAIAACSAPDPAGLDRLNKQPQAVSASDFSVAPDIDQAAVDAFARSFLDSIQAESIAARREFCGYFFRNAAGQIRATPPRQGTFASCSMPAPQRASGIFASYHTHGAFGERYDNEVPSTTDLLSDFALGLDGYVSTPGGRVWRVTRATNDTSQICGLGCVTTDPGFIARDETNIQQRYSLAELSIRSGS